MKHVSFVIKASILFCVLSASFSLLGILFPERGPQENSIMALSLQEIAGHIAWGLVAGVATLTLRYVILGGLFAVLIDSDHLVGLTHIDAISRMSHSISFGIIAVIVLMAIFGKRNYLLGATAFGGMLAHLSYDTFAGEDAKFPIFAPFYNHQIEFSHMDWLYFEVAAIVIIAVVALFQKRMEKISVKT